MLPNILLTTRVKQYLLFKKHAGENVKHWLDAQHMKQPS